jgi:predicted protein tyrosine phosphatase
MKILFVCTYGQQRSPTGVEVVEENFPEHEAKFAGTDSKADVPLTEEAIKWADVIFAMDNPHIAGITNQFPDLLKESPKPIITLGIPDIFPRGDKNMKDMILTGIKPYLSDEEDSENKS